MTEDVMGKLSLSDKRIAEILDEVAEEMRLAEDVVMRERMRRLPDEKP
jgi:hypothetical protein